MKKIVTILPNEKKHTCENFVFSCEERHLEGLRAFIIANDIRLLEESQLSQEIAFILGEAGYLVMLYDGDEYFNNLMIFLPKEVSEKQFEWFHKRSEGIKRYNLNIFDNASDMKWNTLGEFLDKEKVISLLYEKLNEKLRVEKVKKHVKKD